MVGINDNFPVITMLLAGIIILFLTVLHPWEKAYNYGILAVVCVGILLPEWPGITNLDKMHKDEFLDKSEGYIMVLAFFICIPGTLVSIISAIICTIGKK
jgi:hypothetical protein